MLSLISCIFLLLISVWGRFYPTHLKESGSDMKQIAQHPLGYKLQRDVDGK